MKSIFIAALALVASVSAEEAASVPKDIPQYKPFAVPAPLYESFDSADWKNVWKVSQAKKVIDGVTDENLLAYIGEVAVEEPSVWPGLKGDKGLVLKTAGAHHAVSTLFKTPVDPKGKPLVVQYEVKFQTPLECGGAYVKLLTADAAFKPEGFNDKTPYTIMFGPDKCGFNRKVHFIFRHKNPVNGTIEEKHLEDAPQGQYDKKSTLYTLIVQPDNSFEILVNNESVKKGSLLKDFKPPVNPPKEIDDPEDTKPADWVDTAQIPDPDAKKPADWDEDAPAMVPDEDAKIPSDWLENESDTVPDPDAKKPEDWDDEEDGEWTAPAVPNPKCEKVSGCGPWTRPLKKNPAYVGKWTAPLVANPAYKGPWAPRKIANPGYFEDAHPADFAPIGALGFEIWTVQNNILFDNVYVGHSVEDAKLLADKVWKPKIESEKSYEEEEKKANEEAAKKIKEENPYADPSANGLQKYIAIAQRYYEAFLVDLNGFVARVQESPVDAVKENPTVVAVLAGVVFAVLLPFVLVGAIAGSPKKIKKEVKKEDKSPKKEEKEEEETDESDSKTTVRTRKTRTKKDE